MPPTGSAPPAADADADATPCGLPDTKELRPRPSVVLPSITSFIMAVLGLRNDCPPRPRPSRELEARNKNSCHIPPPVSGFIKAASHVTGLV
ncbi:hypothetical protein CDD83_461 [Cordyceps sp. RAO-2017]|nr:hypothetical protein CDD83_461 [Cordyceps sp. RAO-2017]